MTHWCHREQKSCGNCGNVTCESYQLTYRQNLFGIWKHMSKVGIQSKKRKQENCLIGEKSGLNDDVRLVKKKKNWKEPLNFWVLKTHTEENCVFWLFSLNSKLSLLQWTQQMVHTRLTLFFSRILISFVFYKKSYLVLTSCFIFAICF